MGGDIRAWLRDIRRAMDDGNAFGLLFGLYYAFVGLWLTVSTRVPFGTRVYERDWDLIVVLDACRTDALAAVADEYEFLADRETVWSPGSTSAEWVAHTFDCTYTREIARTAYVTANPHSQEVFRNRLLPPQYVAVPAVWPDWDPVDSEAFGLLDEVWVDAHDDRLGVVPPATVTDRAIMAGRETDHNRLIVHYMQPHVPYIAGLVDGDDPVPESRAAPFDALRRGETDRETVWMHYIENLRLVLDEVEVLLENVDADRAIITADHGEAFGEWGFYEHPVGCPLPAVKRVPWAETTAVDRGTRTPDAGAHAADSADREAVTADVKSKLRDLGYQ